MHTHFPQDRLLVQLLLVLLPVALLASMLAILILAALLLLLRLLLVLLQRRTSTSSHKCWFVPCAATADSLGTHMLLLSGASRLSLQ
jgi:hypothetical protein